MINDLDGVLKKILDDTDAPAGLRDAEKSFVIPKSNYAPGKPTVNLYLYDVHENRVLRNPQPIIERAGDSMVRKIPPLRVDCSYILTTYSAKEEEKQPDEEHLLLSQALLWLSRFPFIPEEYLPTEWTDENNPSFQMFPLFMLVAQMDGVKQAGEFWAAMESPPRPAITATVTIAMDLRKEISGPPVTTKITGYQQQGSPDSREELIQIGGRVFDVDKPETGIEGAKVTLKGPAAPAGGPAPAGSIEPPTQTATTDAGGLYTFIRITAGDYAVHVNAQGYDIFDKEKIVIPGSSEDYEFGLTAKS